jgi:hypothetical protein
VAGRRITEYRIVNPDPDDLDNTLIKVAAKRAEADAVRQLPGVLEAVRCPSRRGDAPTASWRRPTHIRGRGAVIS